MMRFRAPGFALFAIMFASVSLAKVEIVEFQDPDKRALYQTMIAELRCLVCQNQNLADSDADLAVDLRRRTRELIEQGKTRGEIADYMVSRYGEFVLYRPPLTAANLLLWIGPAVLLLAAGWIALRRRNARKLAPSLSESERRQIQELLER